jgi:hypothetical protein
MEIQKSFFCGDINHCGGSTIVWGLENFGSHINCINHMGFSKQLCMTL